jgi:hypothetical protein
VDYAGIATLSIGLVALLLALDQVNEWGWGDARIIALLAGSLVLVATFTVVERHAGAHALVPGDMMRNESFAASCLAILLMSATFFASLLYLPQFMQKILGWNPLEAGAGLLPLMGVFAATSFAAGPLYERLGAKTMVSAGAACLAAGTFLISLVGRDSGFGELVPGMVVLGLGVGLFYSSITTAAVTALDPSRSSLAGGIVYMFQVAGGSVGLGLATTVFTTASEDKLQSSVEGLREREIEDVQGVLAGTESAADVLARLGAGAADRVTEVVREAFMSGMTWSFRLVSVLALCGVAVCVLFVGNRERAATEPAATTADPAG